MNIKPARFIMGVAGHCNREGSSLLEQAQHQLRHSPYLELRRVNCDFRDGTVTLAGTVSSYYLRQVAQATVQRVDGVRSIANGLQVQGQRRLVSSQDPD
jgi:osmotically-inducible protein OsmY